MHNMFIMCALLLVIALIVTIAVVPLVKKIAKKTNAVDYPSARRVNDKPTPRLGGVAMFAGMSVSLLLMKIIIDNGVMPTPFIPHPFLTIDWTLAALGVIIMFGVGIIDDIFDLSAKTKLIGQIVSACIVAGSGILLVSIGNPFSRGYIELDWMSYPLTVLYLVSFANIINLIDGLDGLAGGITIIAVTAIMIFAGIGERFDALVLGFACIGSVAGFLVYNKHPASIFMGDSGSLTLGLMLGIISLVAVARSSLFTSLLVPLLAAGVPIIDTFSAIIRRKREHVSIGHADKGHIHHRLLEAGYGHSVVVAIMLLWTACLSAGGVAITMLRGLARYVVFAVICIFSAVIIYKLKLFQPVLEHTKTTRKERRENIAYSSEEVSPYGGKIPAINDDNKENKSKSSNE